MSIMTDQTDRMREDVPGVRVKQAAAAGLLSALLAEGLPSVIWTIDDVTGELNGQLSRLRYQDGRLVQQDRLVLAALEEWSDYLSVPVVFRREENWTSTRPNVSTRLGDVELRVWAAIERDRDRPDSPGPVPVPDRSGPVVVPAAKPPLCVVCKERPPYRPNLPALRSGRGCWDCLATCEQTTDDDHDCALCAPDPRGDAE